MATKTHAHFFLVLLAGAILLGFLLVRPYLSAILVGAILAVAFYPIYTFLLKRIPKKGISAGITLLLIFLIVFIPLFYIGSRVIGETAGVYSYITAERDVDQLLQEGAETISEYLPWIELDIPNIQLGSYVKQILQKVLENIGPIFSGVAGILVHIVITLLTCYYFLKDGDKFREKLVELSPLKKAENTKILETIRVAISSIVRGSLIIGIIQGLLTGMGFLIFGVPNPALWGSLAVIAALVPGVGTALVNIPGVLFLGFTGSTLNAVLLLIWGIAAVGLIDNFLRPYLIGRDTNMHAFTILLSVIGGISVFGPVGFLIGPLFLSFLLALLEIYPSVILKRQ